MPTPVCVSHPQKSVILPATFIFLTYLSTGLARLRVSHFIFLLKPFVLLRVFLTSKCIFQQRHFADVAHCSSPTFLFSSKFVQTLYTPSKALQHFLVAGLSSYFPTHQYVQWLSCVCLLSFSSTRSSSVRTFLSSLIDVEPRCFFFDNFSSSEFLLIS